VASAKSPCAIASRMSAATGVLSSTAHRMRQRKAPPRVSASPHETCDGSTRRGLRARQEGAP
jgi:hypothetical protein